LLASLVTSTANPPEIPMSNLTSDAAVLGPVEEAGAGMDGSTGPGDADDEDAAAEASAPAAGTPAPGGCSIGQRRSSATPLALACGVLFGVRRRRRRGASASTIEQEQE